LQRINQEAALNESRRAARPRFTGRCPCRDNRASRLAVPGSSGRGVRQANRARLRYHRAAQPTPASRGDVKQGDSSAKQPVSSTQFGSERLLPMLLASCAASAAATAPSQSDRALQAPASLPPPNLVEPQSQAAPVGRTSKVTGVEFSREQQTKKSLRKLTGAALDAFEPPSFHGCTASGHCLLGNVCLSQRDGVLVPNVSGAASLAELDGGRDNVRLPWRARVLPTSHFRRLTNVYYARGKTYAAGCWRQNAARRNPAHYLMGYGKLFVAAHDNGTHIVPRDMDHLVFHQCPPRAPEGWEWAQRIWSLIESESSSRGLWKPGRPNIITLGQPSVDVSQLPAKGDLVICAERMTIERVHVATYLGANDPGMVRHWHRAVEQRLHVNASANTARPQSQNPGREGCEGCVNQSRTALRIGIFRRIEGKSGLRRIRNLDEVQALAASFTRVPVKLFTLTSKSSFEEQLWAFRSLDVLITPHGSQLANMLFAPRTVFVELQAAGADVSFRANGRRLVAGYVLSVGHLPTEEVSARKLVAQPCSIGVERGLVRLMSKCFQGGAKNCSSDDKRRLMNTDIFVNLTRLSADLATAVAIRCRSQDCVAKVPSDAPTPQSNPCSNASACWRPDGPVAKYSSACKAREALRHALPGSQVVSRNPRTHLPPCRYEGRSLTFSPRSKPGF